MAEHIQQTIDEFEIELKTAESSVVELKRLLNGLYRKIGKPEPYDIATDSASGLYKPRLDEFANETAPSPAIRLLLQTRGQEAGPLSFGQVFRILKAGGYPFSLKKDEDTILGGLKIAVAKDDKLTKLGEDAVGLAEWYPKRKRLKDKKKDGTEEEDGDGETAEAAEDDEAPAKAVVASAV